ncbi:MAG: hypothetical protein IPL95_16445 [Saprospiraceae bacterium]|nr:hypothetical protein [Saprospiraceae bacterium]
MLEQKEDLTAESHGENPQLKKDFVSELFNQRIQIELLFSTGAIVSLINLPSIIKLNFLTIAESLDIIFVAFLQLGYFFISAGINALIVGFSMNIFFRVLTLCYLGIDFIYPNGIRKERLKYSEYTEKKLIKNTTSDTLIEFSEKLAGFSFSISIILIIKFIGLALIFFSIISVFNLAGINLFDVEFSDRNTSILNFSLLFAILASLGIFDYIFLVLFRKVKFIPKIFHPFYIITNYISLNFLIRKQLHVLNSNLGRFFTGLIIVIYIAIGLITTESMSRNIGNGFDKRSFKIDDKTGKYIFFNRFYDDQRSENEPISIVSIPSKYIKDDIVPLFCVYQAYHDIDLKDFYTPQDVPSDSTQLVNIETENRLNAFGKYITVSLDDSSKLDQKWYFQRHNLTNELGFITFISIADLPKGVHYIKLHFQISDKNKFVGKNQLNQLYINFVKMQKK